MTNQEEGSVVSSANHVSGPAQTDSGDILVLQPHQTDDTSRPVDARAGGGLNGTTKRLFDAVSILATALLVVPMLTVIVRLATLGHVYLGGDLALIDLRVRSALHFHEALGPYDRFGWKHPGPLYFYLLSAVHRVIGDGGRTEFIGVALINLAASLGAVWVVRRHAGRWPALWAALCIALLALSESSLANTFGERSGSPIGVLLSPWNPFVVLFPLILFGVLCAVGATGSWKSLIGAALVGTFTVQTDIATLPIVAVLLFAGVLRAAIRAYRQSSSVPWWTIAIGTGVTALLWLPPLFQQLSNKTGNLTRIWRFFTGHSGHRPLTTGLKLVLTADQYLLGFPHQISLLPLVSTVHAALILGAVLIVALASILLGLRLKVPLAPTLGVASLLGLAVSAYAVARIYGFVDPYLVQWEVAVPLLALLGLGIALFSAKRRGYVKAALCVAAIGLLLLFSVQMARLPVAHASSSDVGAAWHIVMPHLPHDKEPVFLNSSGGPLPSADMLFGLVDELEARGFRPLVNSFWLEAVGPGYIAHGPEPVSIVLYGQSPSVEHMSGYAGHASGVDIVITRTLLSVRTVSLPDATVGRQYVTTVAAVGGDPPYRWLVVSGHLPEGLHLKKATGVISGTPNKMDGGTYTFTVKVVDKKIKTKHHPPTQNTATKVLSITIS